MRVGIIGSNSVTNKEEVNKIINAFIYSKKDETDSLVILGTGGKGVANFVKEWCEDSQTDFVEFLPYHLVDNKVDFSSKFFFIRNKQIIDNSDEVLVIWNGDCKDVEYGIKYSQKKNLPIKVIKVPKST